MEVYIPPKEGGFFVLMQYQTGLPTDAHFKPFAHGILPFMVSKRITFAGGTANAIGDHDGTGDPFTIFNVTGDVLVDVVGIVKTTPVGQGTLEVGVTGATASILAQVADAETMAENELWAPDGSVSLAEAYTPTIHGIGGGLNIIGTVGTANITAGVIDFYCFWQPLSADGKVEAA